MFKKKRKQKIVEHTEKEIDDERKILKESRNNRDPGPYGIKTE